MLERLYKLSTDALRVVPDTYLRPLYHSIDWEYPLTALLGSRGVGKTTLLLQRLQKLSLKPQEALYVDLGDIYFQQQRLIDFVQLFMEKGGKYLFIDEVHRYGFGGDWAQELKQVYDLYRQQITIAFTGSSAIKILQQKADLSRRVQQHAIPGLSFREYLVLKQQLSDLAPLSLTDILTDSTTITRDLLDRYQLQPLPILNAYLTHGYYPFGLESATGYLSRLNETVQLVLESDIPSVLQSGEADYTKLGRLLYSVALSAPFKPNISKLSERLGMSRETVLRYLKLLEEANLLITLRATAKGMAALAKPDKVYLNNTNLLQALAPHEAMVGTVRETFVANQLTYLTHEKHIVPTELRLPKTGDFALVHRDATYLFEVGGPTKTRRQIGTDEHAYAIVDATVTDDPRRIPMWLFGLLY